MNSDSFAAFVKKNPAFGNSLGRMMSYKDNLAFIGYFFDLLNKYGMANNQIVSGDCGIFSDKRLTKTLEEFIISNPADPVPLKRICISKHIPISSNSKYFDSINQDFSNNLNGISIFRNKFNIEVETDIRFKAFDAKKAAALCESLIKNEIDLISFVFDFPALPKNSTPSLISDIKRFCVGLKNTKIRLLNLPFCFIPDARYKYLYGHIISLLKGQIYLQRDTIRNLSEQKSAYLTPCRRCRCRIPCYVYTDIQKHPEYGPFLSPKTQKTVVFMGGSLRETEHHDDEDVVYTSPAEQGDMFMTILEGFKNIIIINGYFYNKFPCTTFEVMLALEQGINVFGSSSIGALRAVELDNYGMTGIGYVYEYLKRQRIKPYHIVAQTYDEEDTPLTIPLVDIIYFLESALSKRLITKGEFNACLHIADNIHFLSLSFKHFFKQLKLKKHVSADVISRLEDYLSSKGEQFFNIKKKDATQLLNEFRNILKNRDHDYVKKIFNQAREKYLKILYSKYHCSYDLTLPEGWKTYFSKDKVNVFHSIRGNREHPPERTRKLAELFFKDLDIMVADTTKYDLASSFIINIIFIPFYFLKYGTSSSTGDGDVFEEALASAYMELVERIPLFEFNIIALKDDEIDGNLFPYKNLPQYYNWGKSSGLKTKIFRDMGYVKVTDILSARDIFIPKIAAMSTASGSDGNASGNSLPEAILYGIYELIERDTLRIYQSRIPHNLQHELVINYRQVKNRQCQILLEQFHAKGLKIILLNLNNIYNIPCVCCSIYDLNNRIERHGSTAARANFDLAIYAALHEAYMGYIIFFSGTRDDFQSPFNRCAHILYKRGQSIFFKTRSPVKANSSVVRFNSIGEELEYVINKLTNIGIDHIIVANTSPNDEHSLKSVKVIIPKLELAHVKNFKPSPFYREKVNRTRQ